MALLFSFVVFILFAALFSLGGVRLWVNPNALKVLYGAKAILAVLLPVVMTVAVFNSSAQQSNKVMAILVAVAAGFFGPNEYVRMAAKRRQKQIQRGLANSLDLMVVCVESGLGLDQAIMQVAKELEH